MHARCTADGVYFNARIVSDHDLAWRISTVRFRFLASVRLESRSVFNNQRKGSDVLQGFDLNSKLPGCALKVADLPRIRRRHQNSFHARDRWILLVVVKRSARQKRPISENVIPS